MSTKAPLLIKYRYRRRLPHLQKADAAVFVTFCTGGRQVLPEAARDLVLEHCRREGGIQLFAGEGARATRVHIYAGDDLCSHTLSRARTGTLSLAVGEESKPSLGHPPSVFGVRG